MNRNLRLRASLAIFIIMVGLMRSLGADGVTDLTAPIDVRSEPPVIITEPGAEFQDEARPGAMIIGMDRTPQGRIWGCWTGTGDKKDGYFLLATSEDGGSSWSKPRLAVGAPDPTGKRQRGALVGNLWTDPLGRLWLFFDQTVIGVPGPTANWFIRCDNPDAATPVWSKPVYLADGCTLNKPTVLDNGDWLLPISHWQEKTAWIYASTDQGNLILDERSSVSYPDGFQAPDGQIHILYDWNRHTDAEILLARFREEDVLQGKLVSPDARLKVLVNKATGPKRILYNGIELPLEWPPRHLDPDSAEPMPVPYLQKPPRVIPIDVGRQLFVDDFLIASTDLQRSFHTAEKFEGNPVFKAETKHELGASTIGERGQEAVTYLGHGGVFFDHHAQHFKMFYTAGWRGPLALATSTDLKQWTRPQLGFLEDNLLLAKGHDAGGDNSVWLDLASNDARIKFLTDRGKDGHFLQTSSDGREWIKSGPTGKAGDYCSIFHNPFRNVWCYSIKQGGKHGRNRWYHESPDFMTGADWSKSVFWANADRLDEADAQIGVPAQLYSLSAVAYESVMLGMFQIHLGPDNRICNEGKFPKTTELKLGFSRDGFHWHRPDRRPLIAATRREGDWDRAYLHTTTGVCAVLDDQLVFPYCAYSGIAPKGTRGMYTGGAIGLATLRRDGFASMDAGDTRGVLQTHSVRFNGSHLFVNFDAPRGELLVELLDESGRVLATSRPVSGDSTKQRIAWAEESDLSRWIGKPVRFRFTLVRGSLYAFWVTPDENGASHGYVGAGGPDFDGVRDLPRR